MSDQQQDQIFYRAQEIAGKDQALNKKHIKQALEEAGDSSDEARISEVLSGASISTSQVSGELVFFD